MDAQQQAQLDQSNAAKQAQAQPPLTAEQMKQKEQMEAALRQQQEQIQAHINQQVQAGVTMYNLDVQRLTITAQGLEALFKVITSDKVDADTAVPLADLLLDTAKHVGFKLKALINPEETPAAENVSCETVANTEDRGIA